MGHGFVSVWETFAPAGAADIVTRHFILFYFFFGLTFSYFFLLTYFFLLNYSFIFFSPRVSSFNSIRPRSIPFYSSSLFPLIYKYVILKEIKSRRRKKKSWERDVVGGIFFFFFVLKSELPPWSRSRLGTNQNEGFHCRRSERKKKNKKRTRGRTSRPFWIHAPNTRRKKKRWRFHPSILLPPPFFF